MRPSEACPRRRPLAAHCLAFLALACGLPRHTAGAAAPSLEDVLGFTNREQLVSWTGAVGAAGDRLAWVEVSRGVSNVWGASKGTGPQPVQLTNYSRDDGMEIELFGFHSATLLHFSRRPSDSANPESLTAPPVGGFYAVEFAARADAILVTREPVQDVSFGRLLYTKHIPADFAAGGDRAAGEFALATVKMRRLAANGSSTEGDEMTLVATKHGDITATAWSPDGTTLAFANRRGDHGFIGLVSFPVGKSVTWLSPSHDTDTAPTWSPAGSRLAFRREVSMVGLDGRDRRCVEYGYCNTAGPAYSIMVVDVGSDRASSTQEGSANLRTSEARAVYTDLRYGYPDGSAGYGSRGMHWVNESALVFGCEASGYVHAALVSATGEPSVRDLTPEPCDNQAFSLAAGHLFVTHNCDTVDSLGLARVDVATGKRVPLVTAENNTVVGMSASGSPLAFLTGAIAFFRTTWRSPAQVVILNTTTAGSGFRTVAPAAPETSTFNASCFVVPRLVTFSAPDGTQIHGQVFDPEDAPPDCGIALTAKDYALLYAQNQHLASLGFVVISINYRGGPGYGVKFRAANASGWQGASEYQDVLAGARWLASAASGLRVDPERIGIHGLSYGGLNTMQALTRNSDVFAAGVANAPVFNWLSQKRFDVDSSALEFAHQHIPPAFRALPVGPRSDLAGPRWLDTVLANQLLAWDSSPAAHLHQLRSPLLVIQGDADANVDFQESAGIVAGLRARGLGSLVESMVVPDERHGFARWAAILPAAQRTAAFLQAHLAAGGQAHSAA